MVEQTSHPENPMSDELPEETLGRDGPTCPWCQYEHYISAENENDVEQDCESCGKPFTWHASVTIDYWAKPVLKNEET